MATVEFDLLCAIPECGTHPHRMSADVNASAAVDGYGLNGHTPLFHTVNSNANRSAPLMRLLLDARARVDVRLAGWRSICSR